jgi:hypothetical protein
LKFSEVWSFFLMAVEGSSRGGEFRPHPVFWDRLPADDKSEFIRLRNQLHQIQQSPSGKDPRVVNFRKELNTVLRFLERSESQREERCILCGIAFAGPFICVNTRLLKSFLGRCKSSINGGFQQMGYVAIKTKTKARACLVAVMRSLTNDPALLRQWTVRGASMAAEVCFVSSFPVALLPDIKQADLNNDRSSETFRPIYRQDKPPGQIRPFNERPFVPQAIDSYQVQRFSAFDDSEWNIAPQDHREVLSEFTFETRAFSMPGAVAETVDLDGDWVRMTNEWSTL